MTSLQVNEILARILFDEYLREMRDIIRLSPKSLKITSISIEDCARIIENAKKAIIDIEAEKTRAAEAQRCRRRERRGAKTGGQRGGGGNAAAGGEGGRGAPVADAGEMDRQAAWKVRSGMFWGLMRR